MKNLLIQIAFKIANYYADKAYNAGLQDKWIKRAKYQRKQSEWLRGAAWLTRH